MKSRPKLLTWLTIGLVLIAISFPIQVKLMFGEDFLDIFSIANKLTPMNWIVMALALTVASLVHRASPLVWGASPLFLLAVAWNNYLVSSVGTGFNFLVTTTATLFLVGIHGILLTPECRMILTQPKKRWWLTPPRKRVSIEARVCPVLGGELMSKTFDLSENGAFISLRDAFWAKHRAASVKNLKVGTYCSIQFKLNQMASLSCTAEIVRQSTSNGNYPGGFGVRFVGLNPKEKKILNSFLKQASAPAFEQRMIA